jgi:hypothetical protein
MSRIEDKIMVAVPVRAAYDQWTQRERANETKPTIASGW